MSAPAFRPASTRVEELQITAAQPCAPRPSGPGQGTPKAAAARWVRTSARRRLYVLNRLYNSISIVDTSKNALIGEIPTGTFDPTPIVIRNGRGFLYDAKLSGNGTGACASCHIDAESDMLAWNRGAPGGNMVTVVQGKNTFQMHPMKGPMRSEERRVGKEGR